MKPFKKVARVYTSPGQPGFLGEGHMAHPVIQTSFLESDPFIVLMDDRLDKKDYIPVGGPHPHAGFETVTLMLEGRLGEGLKAGDLEMMTAGSGIVHTETIAEPMKMRILQLWLNLPKAYRWTEPRVQTLRAEHVPVGTTKGGKVSVYSGTFAGVTSPLQNHTPLVLARIKLNDGGTLEENLPGNYTSFMYVISGSVGVGKEQTVAHQDQVVWLARSENPTEVLRLTSLSPESEVVLYAAEPQHHEIVSHGPFIADSIGEIKELYAQYRAGKIGHIKDVSEGQKIAY